MESKIDRSNTSRLTLQYVLALSMVALLATAGQFVVQRQLDRQFDDGRLINIAGRQRMLSQRIAKCALRFDQSLAKEPLGKLTAELKIALDEWSLAHQTLRSRAELEGSSAILAMLAGIESEFNTMQQAGRQLLTASKQPLKDAVAKEHVATILAKESDFLSGMDALVFQYDREAAQRVARLRQVEFALTGATLLVLLAEGLLIFRPAVKRIREMVARLNQTSSQLRYAKEKAEAANETKSRFLGNISHELRTPLTAVIGMTQLATQTDDSHQRQEYLESVDDAAQSLLFLLNDLIDLSRIEADKIELYEESFSPRELVEHATRMLQPAAADRGVTLSCHVAESTPSALRGDPLRIRQVLVNLINNAIKFTSEGSITVQCEVEKRALEWAELCFSVTDTGIGIAPEDQQQIFESFTQIDRGLNRQHGGAGLGLAICKRLVSLFGGKMDLQSRQGEGSTFSFTAVLRTSNVDTQPQRAASPSLATDLDILVVEDTPINQLILRKLLEHAGNRVVTVADGNAAMHAIRARQFDIALVDVQLPGMDGLEVTRWLRSLEQKQLRPRLPVIAVTAHAMAEDRRRCVAAGMDDYLSKPIRAEVVLSAISRLVFETPRTSKAIVSSQESSNVSNQIDKELATVFLAHAPQERAELTTAIDQSDWKTVYVIAHRLQGQVAVFDNGELRQQLCDLESHAKPASAGGAPNGEAIKKTWESIAAPLTTFERSLQSQLEDAGVDPSDLVASSVSKDNATSQTP